MINADCSQRQHAVHPEVYELQDVIVGYAVMEVWLCSRKKTYKRMPVYGQRWVRVS